MAKFSVGGEEDGEDGGAGSSNPSRAKRKIRTTTTTTTTSVPINAVSGFPPRHEPADQQQTDDDQHHRTQRRRLDQQLPQDDSTTPICSAKNVEANSSVSMFLIDPEVLDCSICYEPLSVPIFQCENGHIACSSCCNKLRNKCATCSWPIGYNRCRAIEKVLESIKLPCKQSKYGCKEIVGYGNESDHEKTCLYAPCKCPLSDCNFMASSKQLSLHFSSEHTDSVTNFQFSSSFTIICLKTDDSYHVLQEQDDGILFILGHRYELQGNAVKICCLSPPTSKEAFSYYIRAETQDLSLVLQSSMKNIQSSSDFCHSTRFLLIPRDVFGSSGKVKLNLCIWKNDSSPVCDR